MIVGFAKCLWRPLPQTPSGGVQLGRFGFDVATQHAVSPTLNGKYINDDSGLVVMIAKGEREKEHTL